MSLLIEVIVTFICHKHKETKFITNLNNKYNLSAFGKKIIYNLFNLKRKCMSQYYTDIYIKEKLVQNNKIKNICFKKSLFLNNSNGTQQWLIGLIEVETKKVRLEFVNERSEEIIKKIILHHVGKNNTLISDDWAGYNYL